MLAGDVDPSRLEVQRQLAAHLATRTEGRMGVVYFAGRAYVLSPLTTDMSAIEMLAEGVRPAAVGLGGSSLASGLTQAIDLLAGGEDGARKSIVVFSDGEETAGAPLGEAIGRARDAGIVIHAVGIGSELGGQIPLTREASLDPTMAARRRGGASVLQGPDGSPVITRLNAASLRQMSLGTGGRYVDGSDGIDAIERELAQGGGTPDVDGRRGRSGVASARLRQPLGRRVPVATWLNRRGGLRSSGSRPRPPRSRRLPGGAAGCAGSGGRPVRRRRTAGVRIRGRRTLPGESRVLRPADRPLQLRDGPPP